MIYTLISFLVTWLLILVIIRFYSFHKKYTSDNLSGPQKVHRNEVSRIGGAAIFLGFSLVIILRVYILDPADSSGLHAISLPLILAAIPAFCGGIVEDITKKIGANIRILCILFSSLLAIYLIPAQITRLDIPGSIFFLALPLVSLTFTAFSIVGLTNAYNLIDGFNGLASMVAFLSLASISFVFFKNGDPLLILSLITMGAVVGFFVWNYPYGLIFLGDGGAYLIGFIIAVLSILVVQRNESVSPFYPLILNAYPIFETVFSIWRRKVLRKSKSMLPDAIHLHSLVYRRIMRWATRDDYISNINNAKTAPVLWGMSCITIIPATIWWNQGFVLVFTGLIFILFYIVSYWRIVRFKALTPRRSIRKDY
jgi:UDP-N-acetylmuramyl pentapeptide phosphotransferase/UDP-N-acetylglucosamine-1-phosphate transferase